MHEFPGYWSLSIFPSALDSQPLFASAAWIPAVHLLGPLTEPVVQTFRASVSETSHGDVMISNVGRGRIRNKPAHSMVRGRRGELTC